MQKTISIVSPSIDDAYSEENIDTTIVNGKIVYHKGIFAGGICEADLIRECAVEVEKMRNRIHQ